MGNDKNQQTPSVSHATENPVKEFELQNLRKEIAELKNVILRTSSEIKTSVEKVMKEPDHTTVESDTSQGPINPSDIVLRTAQLLEHYGVEFNDDNKFNPHRFVRRFEEITDHANLTSENRAFLFREVIKSTLGQVWKMQVRNITTFEELKTAFLDTFWDDSKQLEAARYYKNLTTSVKSIKELLVVLMDYNDYLVEMAEKRPIGNIWMHLYAIIPRRLREKLCNCCLNNVPEKLFNEIARLAENEDEKDASEIFAKSETIQKETRTVIWNHRSHRH